MTESKKTILMEKHSLKIGNRVIKNLTLDDIIDIRLYLIRRKLERREIS